MSHSARGDAVKDQPAARIPAGISTHAERLDEHATHFSGHDPSYQYWMTHAPARDAAAELLSHSGDAIDGHAHRNAHRHAESLRATRRRYRLEVQAGLSMSAARWLAEERHALLLGSDNLGFESFPSSDPARFAPVHAYLLAEKGVSFMEVMWLEELSRDRVYEFLFIASPLKLRGATGSPVRPLAIPLSRND